MRLEDFLEHISSGIIVSDRDGKIIFINSPALDYLGLVRHAAQGRGIDEVLPENVFDVPGSVDQQGKVEIKVAGRLLFCERGRVWQGGELAGVVYVLTDAGEMNDLSQELEFVKKLYRELKDIFDNSFDEIFVTDGKGIVVRVNKVCEEYYGAREEEIVGRHVRDLERLKFFTPSLVPRVLESGQRVTAVQTTKNGQKIIVTANPVFNEAGEIINIVCNSRNITELTNLQQRLQETEKLVETYREEIDQLRNAARPPNAIIAESQPMKQIMDMVEKVAQVESTVLLEGESGVGKGVIAMRIHRRSKRSNGPFISINCGAIPENLMESELFGYTAGAFTGAMKTGKKGLIEMAHGGTLFLDEISELPPGLQVKVLHVIQEKKLMPVGASDYKEVDIRIIAATNKDLFKLVEDHLFREDLFYRLNVVPLRIPPLRHREDDLPLLVSYFVKKCNEQLGTRKTISSEVLDVFGSYHWPGNVRELENLIERLTVTSDSSVIKLSDLPGHMLHLAQKHHQKVMIFDLCTLKEATEEMERQLLEKAYKKYGNTYRMAEALGINQSTVVRKMKKYMEK